MLSLFNQTDAVAIVPMTPQEARQCADLIRGGIINIGRQLLELYERDGWLALDYASWRECAQTEFGFKKSHVYRLLSAAEIERNISPIGENETIPESHLRPLASIPQEEQPAVYQRAVETAPDGKVTAAHVQRVVDEYDAPDTMAVHYSSKTDLWSTPQALFDALNAEFHFNLDVCATDENAKCLRYFTEQQDGLAQEWRGYCWMNPPYGDDIPKWVAKAHAAATAGAVVVCLVPARTDTAWWWDYCIRGEIRFLRGRLKFGDGKGSAPFPSAVIVFREFVLPCHSRVVWWDYHV